MQTATGINRDRLFDSKAPYTELENYYKKSGRTLHQAEMEHEPDWYADITNEYILLDMHGYQEDEITVKGRKQTFKNTTNDTFHTAYASTCHFYITNDKKNYKKTKAVYGNWGSTRRNSNLIGGELLDYSFPYVNNGGTLPYIF